MYVGAAKNRSGLASLAVCIGTLLVFTTLRARAEDDLFATVRLRGGFDFNPTLVENGRTSALLGFDGAIAAGHEADGYQAGLAAEVSETDYANPTVVASQHQKLTFKIANKDQADVAVTATTTADHSLGIGLSHAITDDLLKRVRESKGESAYSVVTSVPASVTLFLSSTAASLPSASTLIPQSTRISAGLPN
jgi:hypothetical protein